MSIVSKVTAYGTPGVVAVGAGAIWGQSLLQWVTQPAHMIVVAGVVATGAAARAVSKGKRKPSVDEQVAELAKTLQQQAQPQSLPESQPQPQPQPFHYDRADKRVIDLGRAN